MPRDAAVLLTPIMLTVAGSCSGYPASILLDSSTPLSLVSTKFVLAHNIPRVISFDDAGRPSFSTSAPVAVPTASGWYSSRFCMNIDYCRDNDVVLGNDWFSASQATLAGLVVSDPTASPSPDAGVEWIISPAHGMWQYMALRLSLTVTQVLFGYLLIRSSCPSTTGQLRRPPMARGVVRSRPGIIMLLTCCMLSLVCFLSIIV